MLYNDDIDEFTLDLSLESRLDRYIKDNFYPAYTISMLASVFLVGGAIRDLRFAKRPKDLDFVVHGELNLDWVQDVLKKFNIDYAFNRFGGFKINYNGINVDLWLTNDLFSAMQYNVDGLYYDVKNKRLLSFTYEDFIVNGLIEINPHNNIDRGRELKLKEYQKNVLKL